MSKILIRRAVIRSGYETLQLFAQRQVWVDWKRGGAVAWRPDYYAVWRRRMDETAALKSLGQAAVYACGHGLRYLVEDPPAPGAVYPGRTVFNDGIEAVIDLDGACGASASRIAS
jgi:hypothetical protein